MPPVDHASDEEFVAFAMRLEEIPGSQASWPSWGRLAFIVGIRVADSGSRTTG